MLAPGTVLQGRYEILAHVGRGGMGTVYRATDLRFRSYVALKEMLPPDNLDLLSQEVEAFEREAMLLRRLHHTGLPRVIDLFTERNGQFLVMDYIDGDDFGKQLAQEPRRFATADRLRTVLLYADELLDVLEYLHEQTVIHSDIKPQNLKIGARGKIVLLDFGLSRSGRISTRSRPPDEINSPDSTQPLPNQRPRGYTRPYAPLEQIRGLDLDARSDLYSLAATLIHMLGGIQPPDPEMRQVALLSGHADPLLQLRAALNHVPSALIDLLLRVMAVFPEARPQSAQEMRKALRAVAVSPRSGAKTFVAPLAQPKPSTLPDQVTKPISRPLEMMLQEEQPTGSPVRAVALNPKIPLIAVGCEDHSIGLWRLDGSLIRTFGGHNGVVLSLAFSPDGTLLASGSEDCTIRVQRQREGAKVEVIRPWPNPVECVAFSPDGQYLAAGGWADNAAVGIWRVNGERLVPVRPPASSFVLSLAFSSDGRWLAAGCYDGTVMVWERPTWKLALTLKAFTTQVLSLAFSANGQYLAAGSGASREGGTIQLWRVEGWRSLINLKGHTAAVRSLIFRPEGLRPDSPVLISGGEDKYVRLWRIPGGASAGDPLALGAGVTSLDLGYDRQVLVSGSRDGMLRIWRFVQGSSNQRS